MKQKTCITSAILILVVNCFGGEPLPKNFLVSQVGKDKTQLIKIYNLVKEIEVPSLKKPPEDFEVVQRIDSKQFLVYRKIWKSKVIASSIQSVGGGGGYARTVEQVVDTDHLYWLIVNDPLNAVDDDTVTVAGALLTEEIKEYTNALGAKASVRVFRQLPKQNEDPNAKTFSQEEFVKQLKSGKTWILKDVEVEICPYCGGRGTSGLARDGRCANCKGDGRLVVSVKVRW